MRARSIFAFIFAALLGGTPAAAQTAREAAVAIDAIAIPPSGDVALQPLASGLLLPWSMAFLPNGDMLIVEKHNGVRLLSTNGALSGVVSGTPRNVLTHEDSGFLDIALDPDFAGNGLVYLAFVDGDAEANRTAIWRARFDERRLVQGRVIFRVNVAKRGPSHPGGRLLFLPDDTLLLSVGDGYDHRDAAQDMASHLGKVLRLTRDGRPAADNPFIGQAGVAPEIWTSGHRNIQGLTYDAETSSVWSHEHGPRGGDEINVLRAGANYGWPILSHGIDYDGTPITERAHADGFERARFFWAPSIAPSGLAIYRGDRYPDFAGKIFVGGLASRSLVRLRTGRETGLLVEEARMYAALRERIRDVRVGPDGLIYVLTDAENGRLLRLTPPPAPAAQVAETRSTRAFDFLVGDWTGQSTFLPAFTPNATPRPEMLRLQCRPTLAGAYIDCDLWLRRENGRERGVKWLWNFNEASGEYELMTLASNYGQASTVQMRWESTENAYVGYIATTTADGRPATERILVRPSEDRNTIQGFESIRPNAEGGPWVQTFDYTLRRTPPS